MLEDFAEGFNRLGIFCALIAGLGRAALSLNRPSWRLASMDNDVAAGLRYFAAAGRPRWRHRGADQQRRQRFIGRHHLRQRPGGGADRHGTAGGAARPAHSSPSGTAGRALEKRTLVGGLVHLVTPVCSMVILFSLLIGYIAFARFLTYQLIWVVLVLMAFYFMVLFATDLCAALFSPQTVSGKMLKKTLSFRIAIWSRCRSSPPRWPNVPCCC